MVQKKVTDAWDDDWEAQADKAAAQEADTTPAAEQQQQAPLTRAERLARHEEQNRKLWQSADSPQESYFLAASSSNAPAAGTGFKPAVKVLSRRPAPKMIAKRDPTTGIEQLTLQDDDDEEQATKNQPTPEEIRMRQLRELEEKQRKYEEARAKIFGDSKSSHSSGQSTPGTVTPPQSSSEGRQNYRGRGRGRGSHYRGGDHRGDHRSSSGSGGGDYNHHHYRNDSQGGRRPMSQSGTPTRELYDPNYSSKPGLGLQKRNGDSGSPRPSRTPTPRDEDQVIRAPRGPDGTGRGGFGFSGRGTRGG